MSRLSSLIGELRNRGRTGLDVVLHPQVKNDELQVLLERLAADPSARTILEIGASDGRGSTRGLVRGMKRNPSAPQLHSIEFSKRRFERLQRRYRGNPNVHCHNVATVGESETLTADSIKTFFANGGAELYAPADPCFVESEFARLLAESHDYIRDNSLPQDGIASIKSRFGIDRFDLVFMDGGPFTGEAELDHVYGARVIAFDDIFDLKNHVNHCRMSADAAYEMVAFSRLLRGGYSVFRRRTF